MSSALYCTGDHLARARELVALTHAHGGPVCATAGSINNGSRLSGLRLIMAAMQRFGRFVT